MSQELIIQIRAWSQTEDYTEGLRLFRDRFGETIRYRSLSIGDSHHNRTRLRELLLSDLPSPHDEVPVRKRTESTDEPVEINTWRLATYSLMDERIALKQRLRDLADNQQDLRREAAFRILEITETLDNLFGKIRYYEKYSRVPEQEVIEEDTRQLPREYLNLRTYISRETKKLHESCSCGGCQKTKQKIEGYFLRMKEIETEVA